MSKIMIVTTFSRDGYRCYGRKFLESFVKHCPSIPIVAYHESLDSLDLVAENLIWRNLDHNEKRAKFIAEHGSDPEKVSSALHPNRQSIRFCHKVFTLAHAASTAVTFDPFIDWLVWIDADVLFHATPDWKSVLPDHAHLSYLGRKNWYTECGFVGYRISDPKVRALIEDMEGYYTTGEIFTRDINDRHDSRCFDICRERSQVSRDRWHNLSSGIISSHVWPLTMLDNFCTHQKGPARKLARYGGIVR